MTKLQRSRLQVSLLLMLLGAGLSFALLGFLSRQMAEGRDPVLLQQGERPVVHKTITEVKKVIKPRRTIYIRERPSSSGAPAYNAPAYNASTYNAPAYSTSTYSAPAYSAPAPVVSSAS